MSAHERRAVLEGIAFGTDPKIPPGDRVRAWQVLRELEWDVPCALRRVRPAARPGRLLPVHGRSART